jgi:predicted sugar kinase
MSQNEIISLVILGVICLIGIISIITAIVRGDMKKFIEEKMAEVEKLELSGKVKLEYVLNAVKEKYKIMTIILNVEKVIEHIIEISKRINYK